MTALAKSGDGRSINLLQDRLATPARVDHGVLGGARRALRLQPAQPEFGGSPNWQSARTPGAARLIATPNSNSLIGARTATVVAVFGPSPEPYRSGQIVAALRAGRTVREVDKALSVLMSRRKARLLISAAKAALASEKEKS